MVGGDAVEAAARWRGGARRRGATTLPLLLQFSSVRFRFPADRKSKSKSKSKSESGRRAPSAPEGPESKSN
jgi:hypothetical protein